MKGAKQLEMGDNFRRWLVVKDWLSAEGRGRAILPKTWEAGRTVWHKVERLGWLANQEVLPRQG